MEQNVGLPMVDVDDKKDRRRNVASAMNHRNRNNDPMIPAQWFKNPRTLLLLACLWPLAIMALFAASTPGQQTSSGVVSPESVANNKFSHFNWRNVLDRVDVMGYGPTHPRVAFVVVGETKEGIIESVKSIFSNTDMNRIFVICAVLDDGKGEDLALVHKLRKIENGST